MELQAEKMFACLLNVSLLWSVCEAEFSKISQPDSFQAVELGGTVTIKCHIHSTGRTSAWFKLTTGRRLKPVASTDMLYNMTTFQEQSHHYKVKSDSSSSHLSILKTRWEDAGTYYCGVMNLNDIQFGSGTFLVIKGPKMIIDSVVQQPESTSVRPGDSGTLSCSVHTGDCAAEHTGVVWLKHSDHAVAEMIHSPGYNNDTCQRTESRGTTCVYNLSSDDAGTYYCVVTSCGQIMFGNGSRINIYRDVALTNSADLSPAVIALMLSNILLGMVTLKLAWMLCKNKKDSRAASRSSSGSPEGSQSRDAVVYAAVCPKPRSSSCRSASVKHSADTVIYSEVRSVHRTGQ